MIDTKLYKHIFRDRINLLMTVKHKSQADIAKLSGIPKSTLSRLISGEKDQPTYIELIKIANAFNVSVCLLFPPNYQFGNDNGSDIQPNGFILPNCVIEFLYENKYTEIFAFNYYATEPASMHSSSFGTDIYENVTSTLRVLSGTVKFTYPNGETVDAEIGKPFISKFGNEYTIEHDRNAVFNVIAIGKYDPLKNLLLTSIKKYYDKNLFINKFYPYPSEETFF